MPCEKRSARSSQPVKRNLVQITVFKKTVGRHATTKDRLRVVWGEVILKPRGGSTETKVDRRVQGLCQVESEGSPGG